MSGFQDYNSFPQQGAPEAGAAAPGGPPQGDQQMGGQMPPNSAGGYQGGNGGDPSSAGGQSGGGDEKTTLWYDENMTLHHLLRSLAPRLNATALQSTVLPIILRDLALNKS